MTSTVPTVITEPGVYELDESAYHADPVPAGSLSSTGARKLLPPSCPARFKYERDNPPAPKKTFDLGHAAHRLVLGAGPDLVRVDADEWRSNSVKAEVAAIRAAGAVPLKPNEYDQVHAMAAALRRHPVAAALFNPAAGRPERSLFWLDGDTDVWCRARLDWQPAPRHGRLIVPDYKTTVSAEPGKLRKAVYDYGYHIQAFWYLDAIRALGIADDAAFVFCAQEKEPPYLVTVFEVDADALELGRSRAREARDIYRRCQESGHWPGYSEDIELLALPAWATRHEENL